MDVFADYLIVNNYYSLIGCCRLISLEHKKIIDSNKLFGRKKSAELLKKTLINFTRDIGINEFVDNILYTDKVDYYKYTLNCIYNIGSNTGYNDDNYEQYKYKIVHFRYDKLHPLKRLRLFKYNMIKKQMASSIYLNMALDHAEKPYSILKAQAINELFVY